MCAKANRISQCNAHKRTEIHGDGYYFTHQHNEFQNYLHLELLFEALKCFYKGFLA